METKKDIINRLKQEILSQQGYKPVQADTVSIAGLPEIEAAFPNGVFPTGMIHEFVNERPEHAAACGGFVAGLLGSLSANGGSGVCAWISTKRLLFPPSLKNFGIEPDQIIFIDVSREREVLWVMEEALKCEGFVAVISELSELNFIQSRRLQLAVEESKVTGFVLRNDPSKLMTTACVARWKIVPIKSQLNGQLPGVGFPRWNVELSKVRNGNPGEWQIEWHGKAFKTITENKAATNKPAIKIRRAG